jgi:hypothetical protein
MTSAGTSLSKYLTKLTAGRIQSGVVSMAALGPEHFQRGDLLFSVAVHIADPTLP